MFSQFFFNKFLSFYRKRFDNSVCKSFEFQDKWFKHIVNYNKDTVYGKQYNFEAINSYESYKDLVPVVTYRELKSYIDIIKRGSSRVLTEDKVAFFAATSGTITGMRKYIPLTYKIIKINHFRAGIELLSSYKKYFLNTDIYKGKSLYLGGSTLKDQDVFLPIGDLSAMLMINLPYWVKRKSVLNTEESTMIDWDDKLDVMVKKSIGKDIRIILGNPSWVMAFFLRILKQYPKKKIKDFFPNLKLYVHGGVNLLPYKSFFEEHFKDLKTTYLEVYNSTEGFYAFQSCPSKETLTLLVNHGVFYEFRSLQTGGIVSLEKVKNNIPYQLITSNVSGLYRYDTEDIIEFKNKKQLSIKLLGRAEEFMNICGEKLTIANIQNALNNTLYKTKSQITEFTVTSLDIKKSGQPVHFWLIEFLYQPECVTKFLTILDSNLKKENIDYKIKRSNNINLNFPVLKVLKKGVFYEWYAKNKKLGGQNKVRRMNQSNKFANELLKINDEL